MRHFYLRFCGCCFIGLSFFEIAFKFEWRWRRRGFKRAWGRQENMIKIFKVKRFFKIIKMFKKISLSIINRQTKKICLYY